MDLASLIVGIIAALLTAWIAIVGRQLRKPRLIVRPGLFELPPNSFRLRPWRRDQAASALAVGVSAFEANNLVLPLPIRLENRSSLPVDDVEIVIETVSDAALQGTGILGPVADQISAFKLEQQDARTVTEFKGMVQSRISLGLVRPRQKMVVTEFVRLRTNFFGFLASHERHADVLATRYSTIPELRSAVELRISVWSSALDPVSFSVVMIWLAANDVTLLPELLRKMTRLSAEEGSAKPGIYFLPYPWRRTLQREELIEMAMIHANTVDDLANALSIDGVIDAGEGALVLRVPPWGLWGESFDISAKARLIRPYADR